MLSRYFRLPRSIAGQIAVLVLAAVVLMHASMTSAIMLAQAEHGVPPRRGLDQLVSTTLLLDRLPAETRPAVIAALAASDPGLQITSAPRAGHASAAVLDDRRLARLREALGPTMNATLLPEPPQSDPNGRRHVLIRLSDATQFSAVLAPDHRERHELPPLLVGTLVFVALNLGLLSWWAARTLTAPLTRFSEAAQGFSLDHDPKPLREDGPEEIRKASRALNHLRTRIHRMVDDRTRMLAAVSHDLRTPITRLRLRAEFVEDATTRRHMLRDLDQMNGMVHAALAYLRDGQPASSGSLTDIATLLQTISDEFADLGHDVSYQGPDHLLASVRSDELHRAITNLVDNAVRFGTRVVVQLRPASAQALEIEVVDNGPGIPDADKTAMLQPFARGDASRNLNAAAGFGLGLSIARATVESHAGRLTLHDVHPSGLASRIWLPIAEGNLTSPPVASKESARPVPPGSRTETLPRPSANKAVTNSV